MIARLLALSRPKGMLLVACLPMIGFGFGLWERGSTISVFKVTPTLLVLALAWMVGHAGAMWLNAALDRDQGSVLLGRAVEVPRFTHVFGYVALVLSPAIAFLLGWVAGVCALACAILSVAYSSPRVAWKGHALAGPAVNGLGYGSLSPIAGWSLAEPVPTWRTALTLAVIVLSIFGVYFSAQSFQEEEDRARGYRTLVVTHGPHATLLVAHVCLRVAMIATLAAAAIGVYPRALLASAPLWFWADVHLTRWRRAPQESRAGGLVLKLTLAGLVTLGGVYAHQAWQFIHENAPGGCGTAVVPAALLETCT
jgi:4-hydroxybenzoate polyprenyltransferase